METLRRDNKHNVTLWEKVLYVIFATNIIFLISGYLLYVFYFKDSTNVLLMLLGANFFIIAISLTWWVIPRKPKIIQFVGDPDSIFLGRPLTEEYEQEEKLTFTKPMVKKSISSGSEANKNTISKKCAYCNQTDFLPYICNYCRKPFCSKHRLPERHECKELHMKT